MTAERHFVDALDAYLEGRAGHTQPDYLEMTLARAAQTRQRPWWSSPERWLPMDFAARLSPSYGPAPWRWIAIAALIVLALGVAIVGTQRRLPPPFGPAANGSMVFARDGDIWMADASGSGAHPIVVGVETDWYPLYSRDGSRFVFLREAEDGVGRLLAANADGGDIRPLTIEPVDPVTWSWSPDGTELALTHVVDGSAVLSIIPSDGRAAPRTLDLGSLGLESAEWRPDGRELMIRGVSDYTQAALYRVPADGSRVDPLTPLQSSSSLQNPAWSPDGTRLAYSSVEPPEPGAAAVERVHVLDLETGLDRVIAFGGAGGDVHWPDFSPDGANVVAVTKSPEQLVIASLDPPDGGHVVGPVLPAAAIDSAYQFSPDGTKILVTFRNWHGMLVDIATGSAKDVPDVTSYASWQRVTR